MRLAIRRTPRIIRTGTLIVVYATAFLVMVSIAYDTATHTIQAATATFTITTMADSGPGSLRDAITQSNATPAPPSNPNLIVFAVAGIGVHTITLQSALPQVTQPTVIDGTTQPGSSCGNLVPDAPFGSNTPHGIMVEIISPMAGLSFAASADSSQLHGLSITSTQAGQYSAEVLANNVVLSCNYFGVRSDGITPGTPEANDKVTLSATNNTFDNNLANTVAVGGTSNARVTNSIFGVRVNFDAVLMTGGAAGPSTLLDIFNSTNLLVGGTPVDANVFGGTGVNATHLYRSAITIQGTCDATNIKSNYIGIMPSGTVIRNSGGIHLTGGAADTNTVIGGTNAGDGNFISGNDYGIYLNGSDRTSILGNYIGAGLDGKTSGVGNSTGITATFSGASNVTIGGNSVAARNIISGNNDEGIGGLYQSGFSGSNKIQGNYIGVAIDGNALPNTNNAISLQHGDWLIGGSNLDEGNVINGAVALAEDGSSTGTYKVLGNIIGLKPDGETPLNYSAGWIFDLGGHNPIEIGGPNANEGNIIAGNNVSYTVMFVRTPDSVKIKGNKIGVTKSGQILGNGVGGVYWEYGAWGIRPGHSVEIGGDTTNEGNIIAGSSTSTWIAISTGLIGSFKVVHNEIYGFSGGIYAGGAQASNGIITYNSIHDNTDGPGVVVSGNTGNTIRYNSIHNNNVNGNGLGIDLDSDGITANDPKDPDTGGNNRQNYPIITASMTRCDGTIATRNVPMFNSTPNTTFTIDYYANPSWGPNSGLPRQGEQWVSSEAITTDVNGDATLTVPSVTYPSVTATAPDGSTSEFGSINNMSFTNCQDILQQTVGTTTSNLNLNTSWTGTNIPNTSYTNNPAYDVATGQYVDSIQKTGLTVEVTVGGQPLLWDEPIGQWQSAYSLSNYGMSASGHLATNLPEGIYDVVLTVTDPTSGLSMTKTYTRAVTVALPKISYTTTFTNNATPTLTGTAANTNSLYTAYVLPKDTILNSALNYGDPGYQKQRVLTYDGSSFKVITNKIDYINFLTTQYNTNAANQQAQWQQNFAPWYLYDLLPNPWSINTVALLQGTCADSAIWQRLIDWFGVSVTSQTECQDWFQQQYDQIKISSDATLQSIITSLDDPSSSYDFTPLVQGTYDVYFLGYDLSSNSFQKNYPSGLVVDFTVPTATLATITASNSVSPELHGTVTDPTASLSITLTGADGASYGPYVAMNNSNGTWTLPAGIIAGGLSVGTYSVTVTVTSLAGNSSAEVKTLIIEMAPVGTSNTDQILSKTGVNLLAISGGALTLVVIAAVVLWWVIRHKR